MKKLYKITNTEGKDFYTGKIKYEVGKIIKAPDWERTEVCGNGLHLVDDINKIRDITGFRLPLRVFEVKIVGKNYVKFDDKIKCEKLRVLKELTIYEINELLKNMFLTSNSSARLYRTSSVELYNNSTVKLHDVSSARLCDDSTAELFDSSSARLYNNSLAKLYNNSSAKLCDNSLACLWNNSSAELFDNSSAELLNNSVAYIYSEEATIIPRSLTCVVIVPNKKVFTFGEAQIGKKYNVVDGELIPIFDPKEEKEEIKKAVEERYKIKSNKDGFKIKKQVLE